EALKSVYRGTQTDGSQQHDYNWVDTAGFQSGAFTATPSDDGGHGSHVAGTIAGSTTTQKIGVAPGAKVIGAKMVFEDSIASTISALDGLQFMLAPTKTDGTSPNPAKGVDVINNSWGAGEWESRETQGAFDSLKAAGILLVNSAGNEGPGAGTVSAPGAYPGHLSIAASDARDGVARFSSRGPSTFGGAVGDTPNISAPGVRINSVRAGGGYTQMDGTSMAAPHVTGAVALMLQANPQASYDEIRDALQSTATDIADPGVDFTAGHGRINVDKAVEALTAAQ
ncbi:MAG: S8 family serine peptidase, partial [Gaiellales bacterium]